jgi:hypothetical protein
MADTGKIHKTFAMYVDKETSCEAIAKGDIVCAEYGATDGHIKKVDTSLDQMGPYGVALEASTADGDTLLVAWRGIVEATHDVAADDALQKNQAITVSTTTTAKFIGADTTTAEYCIIGHVLENVTSTTAEAKIMLAGW